MSNWYLKLCGKFASGFGFVDNYSNEHQEFLSSGFKCQICKQTLMKSHGVADANCYDKNGNKVPVEITGVIYFTFLKKGMNQDLPIQ